MQKATRNRSFLPKSISIIALGLITVLTGYKAAAVDVVTEARTWTPPCPSPSRGYRGFLGLVLSESGNSIVVSNSRALPPTSGFYEILVAEFRTRTMWLVTVAPGEGAFYTIHEQYRQHPVGNWKRESKWRLLQVTESGSSRFGHWERSSQRSSVRLPQRARLTLKTQVMKFDFNAVGIN